MILRRRLDRYVFLLLLMAFVFGVNSITHASGTGKETRMISLKGCEIRLAPGQPTFVRRMVSDLVSVIESFTGDEPQVHESPADRASPQTSPVIAVGYRTTADLDKNRELPADAGLEAYVLSSESSGDTRNGRQTVIQVGGSDSTGVKFGIVELIRRLRVLPGDVQIPLPLQVARQPRFQLRSMYAHLHWWYNHPYALRSWPLEDWKRYIDLLTHLGFNTMQMWPMMELIPHPLSPEDESYLNKYAEVIDYLHKQRGMKGFVGSCPNNITEDARGVPIEKREYFDFEKLLDPGVPANLKRILAYRSDLYQTVADADGYWIIDGDPGGWDGSPASAFVDILVGHRELINEYGARPQDQPVIYWMWGSWGNGRRHYNFGHVLGDMMGRIKGPWRIHVCNGEQMQVCKEMGLEEQAIYFPYNMLEEEPSGPLTDCELEEIQQAVDHAYASGLRAVQGNAQTPLVQLPNIAALAIAAWGGDATHHDDGALKQLADRLVSKDADTVVAGWKALKQDNAQEALGLAGRLRELADDDSARGTLAVIMGNWQSLVLKDLSTLLVIHAKAVIFQEQVLKHAPNERIRDALAEYLIAMAQWMKHTGYHNNRIVMQDGFFHQVFYPLCRLRGQLGETGLKQEIVAPAVSAANRQADADFVGYVIDTVTGTRR